MPERKAEGFVAAIERVNRHARRIGARERVALVEIAREPRPVRVTARVFRDGAFHTETSVERRPCVLYRLSCPAPAIKLPGWTWAGWIAVRKAEKDSVSGAVDAPVRHADPGRPIAQATLDRAFDAAGRMACEHCGTYRNRRMGFVVRDAAGTERVVGSSCLLDHTGHDPKAVLRHFESLGPLREAIDMERRGDSFGADVYDWEAHAASERAAARARDARAYPTRAVVAALLRVMGRNGYLARGTEEQVREALAAGEDPGPGILGRAEEVVAWARGNGYPFPADPAAPVPLGDYLAADPGFGVVEAYARAGHPPLGREYAEGEVAQVTYLGSEEAPLDVATPYGSKTVDRRRHVFKDAVGTRFEWETASGALDGLLVKGAGIAIRFRAKRSRVHRCRLVLQVANVRAA